MNVANLMQVLSEHFSPKAAQITRFAATGYSFEEWLNWEIFSAFIDRGFSVHPKPAYKLHFVDNHSLMLGDLWVHRADGAQLFIEVAVVHAYTQGKWRAKILADRAKLATSVANPSMQKIQLVVSCSSCEKNLQTNWDYWFKAMPFWRDTPEATLVLDDGGAGEVFIRLWQIE